MCLYGDSGTLNFAYLAVWLIKFWQFCEPHLLNFSLCEGGRIGARTYDFQPVDINELKDPMDVLGRIRSQSGILELKGHSQGWRNLATTPQIESKLGHIPVAVVSRRATESEISASMIYLLAREKAPC